MLLQLVRKGQAAPGMRVSSWAWLVDQAGALRSWKVIVPSFLAVSALLLYRHRRRFAFLSSIGACGLRGKKRQQGARPKATRNSPSQPSPGAPFSLHSGYLGLRNEGSTCYLNSILQCLFMTPDFTNNILRTTGDLLSNHVYVFQNLFFKLQYGYLPPSTLELMRCFGILKGRQQDVEEHFRILVNSLPEDIQQLFRIQMVNSLTCRGCKHEDLMQNPLLCLPLAIKDQEASVDRALYDFHEGNILDLDNQCYCFICKRKEDAISCHYFTILPKILVVHLKRYEIYEGKFKKISRPVSVPYSLTVPVKKSQEAASVDPREDFTTSDQGQIGEHQQHKHQDSVTYTIFALCNHYGGLRGGHYTAEIMSFDNKHWYTFDDTRVREMRSRSMGNEIHSDSAYLLMYYQDQDIPRFLEREELPSDIQRRIDETPMYSNKQYRTHPV